MSPANKTKKMNTTSPIESSPPLSPRISSMNSALRAGDESPPSEKDDNLNDDRAFSASNFYRTNLFCKTWMNMDEGRKSMSAERCNSMEQREAIAITAASTECGPTTSQHAAEMLAQTHISAASNPNNKPQLVPIQFQVQDSSSAGNTAKPAKRHQTPSWISLSNSATRSSHKPTIRALAVHTTRASPINTNERFENGRVS